MLSIIAVISSIAISYYTDSIEDAKLAVRTANIKHINEALGLYYKEHLSYPVYDWKSDNDLNDVLYRNINKGLDKELARYFSQKTLSNILVESANPEEYDIYYRVTMPFEKGAEGADYCSSSGVWKKASNMRLGGFVFQVNEIKVLPKDSIKTTTFDDYHKYTISLRPDSGSPETSDARISKETNTNTFEEEKLVIPMVCCPAGTFVMGSPVGEIGKFGNESQHNVTISNQFLIGKYEVTQKQYVKLMGDNPSVNKEDELNPVENITITEANEFCNRLNNYFADSLPHGYRFDLPTEAQWEYACRAGTTSSLNNGKNLDNIYWSDELASLGWYRGNSEGKSHPVGQKLPNAWGIYDMHGNVEELVKDLRVHTYPDYDTSDVIDPIVTTGDQRCHRGGTFTEYADRCRSAYRNGSHTNNKAKTVGLRVALVYKD